jgi:hypothetical protein
MDSPGTAIGLLLRITGTSQRFQQDNTREFAAGWAADLRNLKGATMSIVAILCPKTGRHISTGIQMDQLEFEQMPIRSSVVDCWECGGRHSWSRRWALLIECDEPEMRRAGTPMSKTPVIAST